MASPTVSTQQLTPSNGSNQVNGIWMFEVGSPVLLNYAVKSSGDNRNFTKQVVYWGDGVVDESDSVIVGKPVQFHHTYDAAGEYFIKLGAFNLSGVESRYDKYNTIHIKVGPLAPQKRPIARWAGLALPYGSFSDFNPTGKPSEDEFNLSQDASVGDTTVYVSQQDGVLFNIGDKITIWQEDKLITSSEVVEVNSNAIFLNPDLPLVDSYARSGAIVKVVNQNNGRSFQRSRVQKGWYFPISYDNDLVKAGVFSVLSVTPFERVMLPEFGSRIKEVPFEQNDEFSNDLVRQYVAEAVEQWEPRATVVSVSVSNVENSIIARVTLNFNLETFSVDYNLNELLPNKL